MVDHNSPYSLKRCGTCGDVYDIIGLDGDALGTKRIIVRARVLAWGRQLLSRHFSSRDGQVYSRCTSFYPFFFSELCRTTNVGDNMMDLGWTGSCSCQPDSMSLMVSSTATSPMLYWSWCTVVKGGQKNADSGMSSKPTTPRSLGICRRFRQAYCITLNAIWSLATKIASISGY